MTSSPESQPSPPSLRRRVVTSSGWTAARVGVHSALLIVTLGAVYRVLDPDQIGEVAIVSVLITLAHVLSETGIGSSLVREKGKIDHLLDAAWSLQLVRGVLLAIVVAALAIPIGAWQRSPDLSAYILIAAIAPILEGLRSMSALLFTREMNQRIPTLCDLTTSLLGTAILILLLLWLRSPWAVVIQQVISSGLRSASYYLVHPYRPRWTRKWSGLRRYLRFGIGFNFAHSSAYLIDTLDRLVVGRLLGMHSLGLYDRATALSMYAARQYPMFAAAVIFPGFSKLREHPQLFRKYSRRYLTTLLFGFVAMATTVYLLRTPILRVLLGPKFGEIVPIFEILIFFGMLRGISIGAQVLFDVEGSPHKRLFCNAVQLTVLLTLLPLGANHWGLEGACLATVASGAVGLLVTAILLRRSSQLLAGEQALSAEEGHSSPVKPSELTSP